MERRRYQIDMIVDIVKPPLETDYFFEEQLEELRDNLDTAATEYRLCDTIHKLEISEIDIPE